MRKRIDGSQLSVLVFVAVMALKIFMAPGLLIKYAGRDGWIGMVIYVAFELVILLMILFIIKLNQKSLYEVLCDSLGKVIAKIILAVFCVLLFIKLIMMCGEVELFFTTSMLNSIKYVVCFIFLLMLLVFFCYKGLTPLSRMAQIFFPFVLAALGILFLLTIQNLDLRGLMPITAEGSEIATNMAMFPLWFGDVAVLLGLTGKVKQRKGLVLKGMLTGAISGAIVMYFAVVLFAAYGDYPMIIDYGHNISNMVVYSSGSYLFGRFDIPIFCILMISIFVQIALTFFIITQFCGDIVERGSPAKWAIAVAILLFIMSQFVFNNKTELFNLGTSWPRWLCLAIEIILPVLVLTVSLINKRRTKNENDVQTQNSDS